MKQLNKLNSIAFKLISGFMVVVVLIIVLGAVSYNSSSSAMLKSYKQNMAGTVNATATYLNLGMSQIHAEAQKITEDSDYYNYYRGAYKGNKPQEYMLWSSLYNSAQSAASASDFIMAISIFGDYGDGISSAGTLKPGFYDTFHKAHGENAEDGEEILNTDKEGSVFASQDFYKNAASGKPVSTMVKYNKKNYLFICSPIADTGSNVCCLVPEKVMLKQAYEIRNMTVGITIIAIIVAILVALFLAFNMHRAISNVVGVLEKASNGDLTGNVTLKRKDEFGVLGNSINGMISNMKMLLNKVDQISSLVQSSSDDVTKTSELLVASSDEIYNAMSEIESGTSSQAREAERCLEQMDGLSEKINVLTRNTSEIEAISHNTKDYVNQGIDIIAKLSSRSKDTQDVTEAVIEGINKLNEESKTIEGIVEVISSISDQTSLLSLNASIEAARAGESGKGFAVVADEIRKLADESMQAVGGISDIINGINTQTEQTVETAMRAEQIVGAQQEALETTINLFNNINKYVEDLASNLDDITKGIEQMSVAKEHTLSAIQSISDVSDRSAASTSEVASTILNQLEAVKNLNGNAETLNHNSGDLLDAVTQFKLN